MGKLIDLTGQKFTRLVVIKRVENDNEGKPQWLCQCSCGNQKIVRGKLLRNGKAKSCGCYSRDKFIEYNHNKATARKGDIINNQYPINNLWYERGAAFVQTICPFCNKEFSVSLSHLKSGHTKTCGCLKISLGEKKIQNILEENNIPYMFQYKFDNLLYESGMPARFDFYVNNNYIIEFDGIQHYESNGGWNTKENLILNKQRDAIKNKYCKDNNIPLIRIPYTQYDDLCLEDISLQTSKFIV